MKRKEGIITVVICVILILAGSVGFSLLYHAVFQPKRLIEEELLVDGEWVQAKKQQEREILYPLLEWKENGIIQEEEDVIWFNDFHANYADTYQAVLELTGLTEYSETILQDAKVCTYFFREDTTEFEDYGLIYMFSITQIQNQTDELIIAFNDSGMPVLCQYHTKKVEQGEKIRISQRILAEEEIPEKCYEDIARLEVIFGKESTYRLFPGAIMEGFHTEEHVIFWETLTELCEQYGEWRYYADAENEAYVCVINTYHMILYYDKESNQFCGCSIAQNQIEQNLN